jgi:hypothetical protein
MRPPRLPMSDRIAHFAAAHESASGPEPKYALGVGMSALRVNLTKVRAAFDRCC